MAEEKVTTNELAEYKQEGGQLTTGIFAQTSGMTYSSFSPETRKERAQLFNAVNNPTDKVSAHINEVIWAKDLYAEVIEIAEKDENDEPTGALVTAPRVVFIAADGRTYQAVSNGIFNALPKLFKVFGEPTWDEPLPLKIKQIPLGRNSMLTFEVDESQL